MNLPNKLTLLRIILVPVYIFCALAIPSDWMILDPSTGMNGRSLVLLVIFAAASLTDFLDGYIARKYHLITSFGKFLDPIADKALVNTALILFCYEHQTSVVAVLLMILRDLLVDGLRFSAASEGEVVSAGFAGKLKTVLQMVAIIFILLHNWPFSMLSIPVDQILIWAATAASLWSGWIYFQKLKKYVLKTM